MPRTPGIQYVAVNASSIVDEYVGGVADLSRRSPLHSSTSMMAYSMSKTITAIAVLQLVEDGRIELDGFVDRLLDDIPYRGITVRQLLSHTSGIPNPIPLRWVHGAAAHADFDDDGALDAIMRRYPRLSFRPGTRYRYSNIGYWLLGRIVARASGSTFTNYVETRVIRPLGLAPADLGYAIADPADHASGYLERYSMMNLLKGFLIDRDLIGKSAGRWTEIRAPYVNGAAFGGLVGTARAFAAFLQDQLRDRSVLIGSAAKRLLYDARTAVPDLDVAMTLGWHVGRNDRGGYFYKEGGGGGFHCLMRLYPERGLGTVVMTNATAFPVHKLLDEADGQCYFSPVA
jgi:CubicO group peptidase (beta-lactamase class C family)